MQSLERLAQDHAWFRTRLDALEGLVRMWGDTRWALRAVCYSLAQRLEDHLEREDQLIQLCGIDAMREGHHHELRSLKRVTHELLGTTNEVTTLLHPTLRAIIAGLRRQMDEQERAVLPMIQRALSETGSLAQEAEHTLLGLREDMTVNNLLQIYPEAKATLTRLWIEVEREGADCLDEVAWRHGMTSDGLLLQLERDLLRDDLPMSSASTGGR